jgi:hypothetical protein
MRKSIIEFRVSFEALAKEKDGPTSLRIFRNDRSHIFFLIREKVLGWSLENEGDQGLKVLFHMKKMSTPFKTFKVKLKTILRNPDNIPIIQKDVDTLQELAVRTYQFIKAWCLYCYENDIDIPIITPLFIRYCFRAVGSTTASGQKPRNSELLVKLRTFKDEHLNYPLIDISCLHTPLAYQSQEMEVCYRNNITLNFVKRLQKLLRYSLTGTKLEIKSKVNILTKALVEDNVKLIPEDLTELKDWYYNYRNSYLPESSTWENGNLIYDLKANPYKYVWYLINMERYLEYRNVRTFSAFPLRQTHIPCHITLDTSYFQHKLLNKENRKKLTTGEKKISTNQQEISRIVFLPKRVFKKKGYKFHCMIKTDGISTCVILSRVGVKGKKVKEPKEIIYPYGSDLSMKLKKEYLERGLVGVDPGKYNLVYMADAEGNKLRYTQPQRQTESKNKIFKKKLERRKKSILPLESQLSEFNSRSCFLSSFLEYVKKHYELSSQLKPFYENSWFRDWRFRIFSNRKSSEDKFLNKAQEKFGEKVLAYGDWKGNNFLRNQTSSLGAGMKKILAKRFKLFSVDEFRSSKLHNSEECNHSPLENAVIEGVKKHRCLVCKNCPQKIIGYTLLKTGISQQNRLFQRTSPYFVNRDMNASTNILLLGKLSLLNQNIPFSFQRGVKWEDVKSNVQLSSLGKRFEGVL